MKKSKYPELNDRDWLIQKYWGEGWSQRKISSLVGCTSDSVRRAFIRLDIEKRAFEETILREENHPFYGTHFTKATREKQSKAKEGEYGGENNPFYDKKHTEETIEIIKKKNDGIHHSPKTEFKKGMTPWNKGIHIDGHPHTERAKRKIGVASRDRWQDNEFIQKWINATNAKPNKLEVLVDEILQKNKLGEWRYNGDFSCGVSIGGMIPDFVNINGKKVVIEVFGIYWHNWKKDIRWKQTEFGRKAAYSQLGYKCIVLWETDLLREDAEQFVLSVLRKEKVI